MEARPAVLGLLGLALASSGAVAQDLVIGNARIIDGAGRVIDSGSVVVADGRIVTVTAEQHRGAPGQHIDVGGKTVMPAFIDAHRHIIRGDSRQWIDEQAADRLQEFLEAGYTTLMSGGGPVPGILDLKRLVDSGELAGPRIITSGRVDPSNFRETDDAVAEVRRLAGLGVEIIKARIEPTDELWLGAVTGEAGRHGLEVMVHAVTVPAMLAAVAGGAGKLVHTPHDSFMTTEDARKVADAGIENLSTVGFAVPVFGIFNDNNVPTFRDGSPWPDQILGTGSNAAGEKVVNGRTLWDAGVTYGFGTDTGYHPRDGLKHELRTLNLMFSPLDIVRLMGSNTAAFIDRQDDLGTLEPGKLADIVIVDGDPLDLIFNLLNVEAVIKEGHVVVQKL